MSFHRIRGLRWARICQRPITLPFSTARGAKAAGLRYERNLARGIYQGKHGQWFEYEDAEGLGHCQTDVLVQYQGCAVVLEAKYTWTEVGHRQIAQLYRPVLERALEMPVLGVVVCKVLTTETPRALVRPTLLDALALARQVPSPVLHWLGANLGPLQLPSLPSHLAPESKVA